MQVTALIPMKSFRNAKQRLSPLLGAKAREALAETMFRDVVRQTVQARGLMETVVVTGDDEVAQIAASLGARVMREEGENGETSAVDFARRALKQSGREAVLVMPGDMPLLRAEDIEQVLAQVPEAVRPPFALLVPSHDRMGTNALLLAPPDIINLRFGFDSFSYHMSQVAARGLPLRFFENRRIALDIDDPKDLESFLSFGNEVGETMRVAHALLADRGERVRRSREL